jgi:hypothetical protein
MIENRSPMILNCRWIVFLYIYYAFTFFSGLLLSIIAICHCINLSVFNNSVMGGLGAALLGSSIFYIRKLYKATLNDNITISLNSNDSIKRLGTGIYFIARPFFSMSFSILLIVGLRAGFIISSKSQISLDDGFIYVVMFLSFFVGFLSGKFIKYLENEGEKIITSKFIKEAK